MPAHTASDTDTDTDSGSDSDRLGGPIKMQELLMRDIKIHYYYIRLLLRSAAHMPAIVAALALGA